MKKLFEIEIVTHWMAAILKTDLYRKLEQTKQTEPAMRKRKLDFSTTKKQEKTEKGGGD